MQNPVVSIICTTYNHEPYIRECLDGFMMQQTDFPFEVLIHDDASIDKSADIIREYEAKYPDIIKPIYQTDNQYSKGVKIGLTYLYPRAKGKYIAECEGDDYWTDPLKLQKQVDFMERHPEYVMCSHSFINYYQIENRFDAFYNPPIPNDFSYDINEYIKSQLWITQPLSILYRSSNLDIVRYSEYKNSKDVTLCYFLLKHGPGYFMANDMGVYRRHSTGVWTGSNRQDKIKDGLLAVKSIYDIEQDEYAARYLVNVLKGWRYLGVSFFKRNMRLYIQIIRIIYRYYGG